MAATLVAQLHDRGRVLRDVMRSRDLRRNLLAFGFYYAADWALLVGLGVYAYEQAGVAGVGIVRLMQMLPGALSAAFVSLLGDRVRRERLLLAINGGRGLFITGAAVAAAMDAPVTVIYAIAAADAVVAAGYRPTQWALVPLLTRTPQELVAANAASGTIEGVAVFLGPAAAGAFLAAGEPALALAAAAGSFWLAALVVAGVRTESGTGGRGERAVDQILGGLRTLRAHSQPRLLVLLFASQTLVRGMLNVLIVVAAIELTGMGEAGAGFLNSVYGVGALVGAAAAAALVGPRRLGRGVTYGLVLWGVPIALIGVWPEAAVALAAIAGVGIGNAILSVGGLTLLQRLVPDEVLARVFGVMETLILASVGLGAILTPLLIEALGLRAALLITGAILPTLALLTLPRLRRIDAETHPPEREILPTLALLTLPRLRRIDAETHPPERELAALASVDMFAPLPGPALERVARRLTPVGVRAGDEIVREGETGDRFYVIESGTLTVSSDGRTLASLGPGGYFGELALLRDVPRTATVTADTDGQLFALDREDFIATLNAHPHSAQTAAAVVAERFGRR